MQSVITTKLACPQIPGQIIRKNLFQRISGPGTSLSVVQGEMGCGKTSLVSSFVREEGSPCLWYRLDSRDSDPDIFIAHLEYGLRKLCLPATLPELSNHGNFLTDRSALSLIIGYLESSLERLYIVLDDYHLIETPSPVNSFVSSLVSYLPENAQVIIASEKAPLFPLSELRSQGRVREIRGEDLKFSLSETQEFFAGSGLDRDQMKRIWKETEGWAAGLRLALYAVTSHREQDSRDPVKEFHSYTEEYLKEQVVDRIDPEQLGFLEDLAVLAEFDSATARELTGYGGAESLLQRMVEQNLFAYRLEKEEKFRFHELLRSFLEKRLLERRGEKEYCQLLRKAGEIYLEKGERDRAFYYLQSSGDYVRSRKVLVQKAPEMCRRGSFGELKKGLAGFPENFISEDACLLFYRGMVEEFEGQFSESMSIYREAEKLFVSRGDYAGAALTVLKMGNIFYHRGKGQETVEQGLKAVEYIDSGEVEDGPEKKEMEIKACELLFRGYLGLEKWEEAARWSDRMAVLTGNFRDMGELPSYCIDHHYFFYSPCANLLQVLEGFRRTAGKWRKSGNRLGELAVQTNMAMIYSLTGEYRQAEELIGLCLEKADRYGDCRSRLFCRFVQAHVEKVLGRNGEAARIFRDVVFRAQQLGLARLQLLAHYNLSGIYRREGNREAAGNHAETALELAEKTDSAYLKGLALMIMGQIRGEAEDYCLAEKMFRQAREYFRNCGAGCDLGRADLLQAGMMIAAGKERQKIGFLARQGLAMVQKEECEYIFHGEKSVFAGILKWCLYQGIEEKYVRNVLTGLGYGLKIYRCAFYTLGSFRVEVQGNFVDARLWRNRKVVALLQYLLVNRYKKIERDMVLETFWPEMEEEKAAANLSSCLYTLRHILEPDIKKASESRFVKYQKGLVWLDNSRDLMIDAQVFSDLAFGITRDRDRDDTDNIIGRCREALSLYGGDFLEEYAYEDWIVAERERLRDLWFSLQEILGSCLEKKGDYEEAARVYRKMVAADPYREKFYRLLVGSLARDRQKAPALKWYRECVRIMREEFGVSPGEDIEKLIEEMD